MQNVGGSEVKIVGGIALLRVVLPLLLCLDAHPCIAAAAAAVLNFAAVFMFFLV